MNSGVPAAIIHMECYQVPVVDEWFPKCESVWEEEHQHLEQAAATRKRFSDQHHSKMPQYQPGDRVWLVNKDVRNIPGCKKLAHCYTGPYRIIKQINLVTY